MIKVAIVDNEKEDRLYLQDFLERYQRENSASFQISGFDSGVLFLEACRFENFDLVFMDVEMPDMDGFATSRRLRKGDPAAVLVFVTNAARHAIRGYEVDALDYIVKPLSYEAFFLKLPKALALCKQNDASKLVIRKRSGRTVVSLKSVVYIESSGHNITYHTETGDITTYGTMKEVEEQLPSASFFRCNSGYIVNLSYVEGCEEAMLKLSGGCSIEISRTRRKEFLDVLQRFYLKGGRL